MVNIEGSPQDFNLYYEKTSEYNPLSFGGQVSNTSFGITGRTEMRVTAAYEVFFDRRELSKLRFDFLRPTYLNVNALNC